LREGAWSTPVECGAQLLRLIGLPTWCDVFVPHHLEQAEALESGPAKDLRPVHKRKLLHVAAVLRCRRPPGHGNLTRPERSARRAELAALGILPVSVTAKPEADEEDVVVASKGRRGGSLRNTEESVFTNESDRGGNRGKKATTLAGGGGLERGVSLGRKRRGDGERRGGAQCEGVAQQRWR